LLARKTSSRLKPLSAKRTRAWPTLRSAIPVVDCGIDDVDAA
jgi:hypothetical protein